MASWTATPFSGTHTTCAALTCLILSALTDGGCAVKTSI
ncbi:hypothetical protein GW13_PRO0198 [Salmonella enterica subsp. enterica serovar Cerro]|nr:hypothetical protein GW13_PRO0198 [Salmonella enterica subsp. enterica serovar Cerro]